MRSIKIFLRTVSCYLLAVVVVGGVGGILYLTGLINILRFIAILYIAGALIIPLLFVGFGMYQMLFSKKDTRKDGAVKLLPALICLGLFVYISLIEPGNLRVEHIEIAHPFVSEEMRIIHISDIQSKNVGRYERKVFEILKELPADIILHTGDLVQPFYYSGYDVSRYEPELRKLAQLFQQLQPQYGTYNVIGDTELPQKIPQFDELSGVTTLQDEAVVISTPKGVLNIFGLGLESSRRGRKEFIDAWMAQGNRQQVRILMGHAPDYIQMALDTEVDLCLAGHTHGGQIQLPFVGPLLASSSIPKSWARGFTQIRSVAFNVSAGIGVSHAWGLPPMRFRCPPTITVIHIFPEKH
jgi:hypothetical protein